MSIKWQLKPILLFSEWTIPFSLREQFIAHWRLAHLYSDQKQHAQSRIHASHAKNLLTQHKWRSFPVLWSDNTDQIVIFQHEIQAQLDYIIGLSYKNIKDFHNAEFYLERAVGLDPSFAPAYASLGVVYLEEGKTDLAVKRLSKAVELSPKSTPLVQHESRVGLGIARGEQGHYDEAIELLTQAIATSPNPNRTAKLKDLLRRMYFLKQMHEKAFLMLLRGDSLFDYTPNFLSVVDYLNQRKLYGAIAVLHKNFFYARCDLENVKVPVNYRTNAAVAAVLFGCGQGNDSSFASESERSLWRDQALKWLQADLQLYTGVMERVMKLKKSLQARSAELALRYWTNTKHLSGVRDADSMKTMLPGERQQWEEFWKEVNQLLHKIELFNNNSSCSDGSY